jgi:hypothetical protein
MKITQPTPFILAAAIMSGCIAYIAYIDASSDKDATTRTVATTRTHAETPAPPLITIKKLPTPLKARPPAAMAHPDIAQNPEAIKVIKLERLKKVFPNLQEIPSDWRTFNPQILTIAPYEDIQIPFHLDEVKTVTPNASSNSPDARTVQVYRNDMQGGYTVTAATENEMIAIVTVPGADIFQVHVLNDEISVTTAPIGHCGNTPENPASQKPQTAALEAQAHRQIPEISNLPNTPEITGAVESMTISNVVFFYNEDTLTKFQNTLIEETTIATTYIAHVEAANIILANSDINNLRWNYAGAFKTPDFEITPGVTDETDPTYILLHNAIDIMKKDAQVNPGNKEAHDFIMAKIEEVRADQSAYIIGKTSTQLSKYSGLGTLGYNNSLSHTISLRIQEDYSTLTHELGHNFGCRHDRLTEKDQTSTAYNFGHVHRGSAGIWGETDLGTVMSYATFIPYFSSPLLSYQGNAIGIPEGQAGAADNARYMREKASYIKITREKPTIITQPQNTTVVEGTSFTISTQATSSNGSPLTYQWKHNGTSIPGATGNYYSKTANNNDTGSYTVTVSNQYGNTSSNPATITVTAPPKNNGGGSGGGGGGSPSFLFLTAIGIIALLKKFTKDR